MFSKLIFIDKIRQRLLPLVQNEFWYKAIRVLTILYEKKL